MVVLWAWFYRARVGLDRLTLALILSNPNPNPNPNLTLLNPNPNPNPNQVLWAEMVSNMSGLSAQLRSAVGGCGKTH